MAQNQPTKSSNLILFMILAFGVVMVHGMLFQKPKPPQNQEKPAAVAKADAEKAEADKNGEGEKGKQAEEKKDTDKEEASQEEKAAEEASSEVTSDDAVASAPAEALPTDAPQKWITLGSADPSSPYSMLVTLTDRGAAVTRVELNSPRYPQLMDDDGFLADRQGYMGRIVVGKSSHGKGCPVDVVGKGTPAEKAGIKPGDLIVDINGHNVTGTASYFAAMAETRPKRTINVTVLREGKEKALEVTLTRPPVEVVRPEGDDPLSFLMTMSQLGDEKLKADPEDKPNHEVFPVPIPKSVEAELPGLNLRTGSWTLASHNETEAVFECMVPGQNLKLTKTYRLATAEGTESKAGAYHLVLDVKVENTGNKKIEAAYQLDGPTGLPLEGWWYANKVGYCWSAGLRDAIVFLDGKSKPDMVSCTTISEDENIEVWEDQSIIYLGIDAQYFSCVMIPEKEKENEIWLASSQAIRVGPVVSQEKRRLTNVSCRMRSLTAELEPGKSIHHSYKIFTGPKAQDILAPYDLGQLIYYGWFNFVAEPMVKILHFFHAIVMNYGLAIILLTVLVRGAMYPMSRKQALAAAKMAELQPEIKKIQEKYKKDLNAKHRAQQELFKKHNYNPAAGCLVMFIQLPIFIGLYRGLMVDIELRGSALLGTWTRWCSNLAAPDMLIDWHNWMPGFVTKGIGIFGLGPYFNLLPILTIILFIVQQKLMMPPPADEAQAMQQKMMKYMMLFMGLLFFKVASGLCIYFVASSLWGVAERKLLPKHPGKENPPPPSMSSAHRKKK